MSGGCSDVAALYVHGGGQSIYANIPGVDCWDAERDARLYPGPHPVIAHPPCRFWAALKGLAGRNLPDREAVRQAEHAMGLHAIEMVRRWGGVLEHPIASDIWDHIPPMVGMIVDVDLNRFGFPATKRTRLWFHRCTPLPIDPSWRVKPALHVSKSGKVRRGIEQMSGTSTKRSATPPLMARWLVESLRIGGVDER